MLNRRYIRVKVFQALYSFYQSDKQDREFIENELIKSINGIYDLYVYMLLLLVELKELEATRLEQAKSKRIPTEADLDPNKRFVDCKVFQAIENNEAFKKHVELKKLSWNLEESMLQKILKEVKESGEYAAFMTAEKINFEAEKTFVVSIFKKIIWHNEALLNHIEDKSIYWLDDLAVVNINIAKTINKMTDKQQPESTVLINLFKDKEDDLSFVKELYRKTISFNKLYEDQIKSTTKNWDADRIAKLDLIMMKMGLCEMQHFKNIPVKVTLNEYIEMAKDYSTPKSKIFINGILDKLVSQLKETGEIEKSGRGLVGS